MQFLLDLPDSSDLYSTTAAFPAIRCQCGKTISPPLFQQDALRRIQPEYPSVP